MIGVSSLNYCVSFGLALELVVVVDVAVLALALRIHLPGLVLAVSREGRASVPVVAVVAHAFSKVLQVRMLARKDDARLAATLAKVCLLSTHLFFVLS